MQISVAELLAGWAVLTVAGVLAAKKVLAAFLLMFEASLAVGMLPEVEIPAAAAARKGPAVALIAAV